MYYISEEENYRKYGIVILEVYDETLRTTVYHYRKPTPKERKEIILNYIIDNSGIKSPRKYATSVGLPPTTFYQWLDKYQKNLETNSETTEMIPVVRTVPPKFYDITNEANESSLAKLNNSQNIGLIKLTINEMKLEFDVSNIKMVLEALK